MGGQFEIGRIARIPILIDFSFILLIVLWGQSYFTSGNTQMMSAGVIIIIGLAISILIHEFAHAAAGHLFGVRASHVELNASVGFVIGRVPCAERLGRGSLSPWPVRFQISCSGGCLTPYLVF